MDTAETKKIEPLCPHFELCGGCQYQDIAYEDEAAMKEGHVLRLLKDAGINGFEYHGFERAPSEMGYRNKMEFSFGDEGKGGPLALGLRKRNSFYEVVSCGHCAIVDEDFRAALLCALCFFQASPESFYHKKRHLGALRHLVVRKGFFTGEILINIVTTSALVTDLAPLADELARLPLHGKLAGVLHTVNDSVADAVKADKVNILRGQDYFFEKLLGLTFKISAFSFFQTNSAGAERLYDTVRSFTGDAGGKTVFDLYCGTGTITQIAAKNAKLAVGVELDAGAVEAARENAAQNRADNCVFIAGDVLAAVDGLPHKPDIIILDPPREGVHPKAMKKILGMGAEKIVYVSCKPASLARDLQAFVAGGYAVSRVRVHDMFPRTKHVESVVLMSRVEK